MILVILCCYVFLFALCDDLAERLVVACALLCGRAINPVPLISIHPCSNPAGELPCTPYQDHVIAMSISELFWFMWRLVHIEFYLRCCDFGYVLKPFLCIAAFRTFSCLLHMYSRNHHEHCYLKSAIRDPNPAPTESIKTSDI